MTFQKQNRENFIEKLEIPIYLDRDIKEFFNKKAMDKNTDLDEVINKILRKEIELLKVIGE